MRDRVVVGAKQDDSGVAKTNIEGSLLQYGGSVNYTPAGANAQLAAISHSGCSVADHANHNHAYGTLAVADHAHHTHPVTSNVTVADHAALTHSSTAVNDHTTTPIATGTGAPMTVVTGKTHTVTQPAQHAAQAHTPTNNQVTSGNENNTQTHVFSGATDNPNATQTHAVTQSSDHPAHNHVFSGAAATIATPYYALVPVMYIGV
jgi:hypothetical protein